MKRWIAVCISLIFVAGCSGAGGGGNRFLPQSASPSVARVANADAVAADALPSGLLGVTSDRQGRRLSVAVTMRIPKHHRGERAGMHPATISPLTQSVSIAVNSKARVFNATPASPNCSAGSSGTTCTFTVAAPAGNDTFVVTTYSGVNGSGTALNRGTAIIPIVKGKANSPHITLGPLVSTTANTGMGSLRYAIGTANPGDTILFSLPTGSSVKLSSPITLNGNLSIAGPGVKASLRTRKNRHGLTSNATFTGLTVSGNGTSQVFIINAGVKATISGLIITDGKASVAHQPGGAISNLGTLTLASDAVTDSTSVVTNIRIRPHTLHHALHPRHVHKPKAPQHKHRAHAKPGPKGLRPHVCGTNQYGGALYNNGTLTITGTTFDGNVVSDDSSCSTYGYGGAIYNDSDGSIFSSGSTYSNNGAGDGGAVYNDATYGQASFNGDTFIDNFGCNEHNGCTTTGCSTASTCTTYAYGYGAAIYDADGPGVAITNSTFKNNLAGGPGGEGYGEGGALFVETGSPLITGSVFTGNVAGDSFSNCGQGYGGAIYEDAGGTIELDNDTFTSNIASGDEYGYGGAIYNDDQLDHGSGNKFTGNQAIGSGSDCESEPYAEGGALYADYGINMSGSTFTSNTAKAAYEVDGGAIYTDDPSTLNGDTFTGNSAIATGITDEDSYAYGGAIEEDDGLALTKSSFTSNTAQALGIYGYYVEGGVIYAAYPLTSTNNVYSSNSTNATYQDDAYTYGGVIYSDDTLVSSHDTFKNNTNTSAYDVDGGVIFLDSGAANIANDTFTSNTINAPYAYGGAVEHDTSSSAVISNSTFTGNVAGIGAQYGQGGATWDDYATTYNGDAFTGNKAVYAAGAIYDDRGDTINNSTFTGNVVTASQPYYGGGALLTYSTTVNNSTFMGNSDTTNGIQSGGGAIYNYDGLTMTGSTLSGNKVLGSNPNTGGGGVFDYDDDYTSNSTIANNSSAWDGGGYDDYSASYTFSFTNVTSYGNSATRNGGNMEIPYNVTLTNSIVAGGTAGGTGPDVDVNGSGVLYSGDYNLFGKGVQGSGTFTPASHDQVGSPTAALNPVLAALSANGGPTQTMADSPSSTRIYHKIPNAGGCNSAGITTDQRGYSIGTNPCDIGAFDYSAAPSATKVRPGAMALRGHGRHHPKRGHAKRSPFDAPPHQHRHGVTK